MQVVGRRVPHLGVGQLGSRGTAVLREACHRARAPLRLHEGARGVLVVDDGHGVARRVQLAEPGAERGGGAPRSLHRAIRRLDRGGAELVRLEGDVHGQAGFLDHEALAHRGGGAAAALHGEVSRLSRGN